VSPEKKKKEKMLYFGVLTKKCSRLETVCEKMGVKLK
jgi:hypothetical protein